MEIEALILGGAAIVIATASAISGIGRELIKQTILISFEAQAYWDKIVEEAEVEFEKRHNSSKEEVEKLRVEIETEKEKLREAVIESVVL